MHIDCFFKHCQVFPVNQLNRNMDIYRILHTPQIVYSWEIKTFKFIAIFIYRFNVIAFISIFIIIIQSYHYRIMINLQLKIIIYSTIIYRVEYKLLELKSVLSYGMKCLILEIYWKDILNFIIFTNRFSYIFQNHKIPSLNWWKNKNLKIFYNNY